MSAPSLFNLAARQQREGAAARFGTALAGTIARGEPTSAAVRAVLGTNSKSASAQSVREGRGNTNLLSSRARRYRMQRQSQKLLPLETVSGCSRNLSASASSVSVVKVIANESVGYRGIFTCGSVWHCPVCANKIAERRRAELQAGIASHVARGGKVYMMTLTFPHTRSMDLRECLEGFSKALSRFKARRAYTKMKAATGFKGVVRALEVTHGENGWHPHTHELIFADGNEERVLAELETLRDQWAAAVRGAGLGQINEHGFSVQGADQAADYVSKFGDTNAGSDWDVSREMTRQHSKLARLKGRTPFALLHDSMIGDAQASHLFLEYAYEFKGKRQLYYTPGLRDYLGLDDISDEEIAAEDQKEPDEETKVIWTCTQEEWSLLVRSNTRGEFLDIAATQGTDGCYVFLQELLKRPWLSGSSKPAHKGH